MCFRNVKTINYLFNASLNAQKSFALYKMMGLNVNTDSFFIVFWQSNVVVFAKLS